MRFKKLFRNSFSKPVLYIIAILRAIKVNNQVLKDSSLNTGSTLRILYKILNLDFNSVLTAESGQICYYKNTNQGTESLAINYISNEVKITPNENVTYVVLKIPEFYKLLEIEIYMMKILFFFTKNKRRKNYLNESILSLTKFYTFKFDNNKKENSKFHRRYFGSIQHFQNKSNKSFLLGFQESILLIYKKPKNNKNMSIKLTKTKEKSRLLIFYMDNFSKYTKDIVSSNPKRFPCLSSFFNSKSFLSFDNTISVSNWTFPAAVSMLSGLKFEEHLTYHPEEKCYLDLLRLMYRKKRVNDLEELFMKYPLRFRSGTNWRMKQHHGHHSIFTHSFTYPNIKIFNNSPIFADIYSVIAQTFKHLDMASDMSSLHWIDIMDTHHPVNNAVLPIASRNLKIETIQSGLNYENGAKYAKGNYKNSSRDIYLSQIAAIDSQIQRIINYSSEGIPLENHTIIFLSDHGTHIMKDDTSFSKISELHSPLLAIWKEKLDLSKELKMQTENIHPSRIFNLINNLILFEENKKIKSFSQNNISYSQIIYPNQPYEILIKFDKNNFYCFRSTSKLPKKNLKNKSKLIILLKEMMKEGEWTHISSTNIKKMNFENLPKEIINLSKCLLNSNKKN